MNVLRLESCFVQTREFIRCYGRIAERRSRSVQDLRCPICFNYPFADTGVLMGAYMLVEDSVRFRSARERAHYFAAIMSRLSWNVRQIWACGACVGQMIMNRISYSVNRLGRLYTPSGESRWVGYVEYPYSCEDELECLICDGKIGNRHLFPRNGGSVIVVSWSEDVLGLYANIDWGMIYCIECAGNACVDALADMSLPEEMPLSKGGIHLELEERDE